MVDSILRAVDYLFIVFISPFIHQKKITEKP